MARLALTLVVCLLTGVAWANEPTAAKLFRNARKAEKKGRVVEAYLLYSQAAAKEPANAEYWGRAQALQRRAALEAGTMPTGLDAPLQAPIDDLSLDPSLTDKELSEVEQLGEPATLEEPAERREFSLQGTSRQLFEQVAQAYNYTAVFDADYTPTAPTRFRLEPAGLKETLRLLEATTSSFVVPLGPRLFLVARDNPQKRQEHEPVMAQTVPIPEPVAPQEAQELARSVQQAFEIQKLQVDSTRRLVVVRDRVSKVRPAVLLLHQLMAHRPQVRVELEFIEVNRNSTLSYGLRLPTEFPLVSFGNVVGAFPRLLSLATAVPAGFTRFLTFGGGATFLGVGVTDAELFASMTKSNARSLLQADIRSLDGQAATMTVGEKFPIVTGYFGSGFVGGGATVPGGSYPPSFNFEDLGLTMKVTPRVHGEAEVSLEIETEFKVLGAGSFNGVPVVNQRKFTSRVRLKGGEWGVIAGLVTSTQARTISGLAGLSQIPVLGPLLRSNNTDTQESEVLLVLKPTVLSLPAAEFPTRSLYVGTETRPLSHL